VLEFVHKLYRNNVSHFCSDMAELSICDFESLLAGYVGTLEELIKWLAGITNEQDLSGGVKPFLSYAEIALCLTAFESAITVFSASSSTRLVYRHSRV